MNGDEDHEDHCIAQFEEIAKTTRGLWEIDPVRGLWLLVDETKSSFATRSVVPVGLYASEEAARKYEKKKREVRGLAEEKLRRVIYVPSEDVHVDRVEFNAWVELEMELMREVESQTCSRLRKSEEELRAHFFHKIKEATFCATRQPYVVVATKSAAILDEGEDEVDIVGVTDGALKSEQLGLDYVNEFLKAHPKTRASTNGSEPKHHQSELIRGSSSEGRFCSGFEMNIIDDEDEYLGDLNVGIYEMIANVES